MKMNYDFFDDLIRLVLKKTPKQFDQEMIKEYQDKIDELHQEYEHTDPWWDFIRRARLLREIGKCTLKVKFYQEDLEKRCDEEIDNKQ